MLWQEIDRMFERHHVAQDLASEQWTMTQLPRPDAPRRLHHVGDSRGELSGRPEHAHTGDRALSRGSPHVRARLMVPSIE